MVPREWENHGVGTMSPSTLNTNAWHGRERWTPDVAEDRAGEAGIVMTTEHWQVVNWMRSCFRCTGKVPTLRAVEEGAHVPPAMMRRLFQDHTARTAAWIAGLETMALA